MPGRFPSSLKFVEVVVVDSVDNGWLEKHESELNAERTCETEGCSETLDTVL